MKYKILNRRFKHKEEMTTVAIIINSCEKFWSTTSQKILPSLERAKIPGRSVYVVVGECDYESEIVYDEQRQHHIVYCRYVNESYNAAIYFTQNEKARKEISKYSHLFYTQDTTSFCEDFGYNIQTYAEGCNSYIKLLNKFTKNIGLFNVSWFLTNKTELMRYFINYDKSLIIAYKSSNFVNKDIIYSKFKNLGEYLGEDSLFEFDGTRGDPLGPVFPNKLIPCYLEKVYSKEDRLVTVYKQPGILKYQKNWSQANMVWNISL